VARATTAGFEFVEFMPTTLRSGTIYISTRFRTTAHLCLCGCGEKVVNPLRPDRWSLSFDGSTISLSPSVGNSGLPCKSHYWIKQNRVRWLPPMTDQQSAHAFARDGWTHDESVESSRPSRNRPMSWWRRVLRWLAPGRKQRR